MNKPKLPSPAKTFLRACVAITLLAPLALAQGALRGPSFVPQGKLTGPTFPGWHTVGGATWNAANGEITASGNDTGGWLAINTSYQDTLMYLAFRCEGDCDAGVIMRMTAKGGTMIALHNGDAMGENVTIGADSRLQSRTELRAVSTQIRFAPPASTPPERPGTRIQGPFVPSLTPIKHGIYAGQWNEMEMVLDADVVRGFLNLGGTTVTADAKDMDGFGPFALYVGPHSVVHFKDVQWKDVAFKTMPVEEVGKGFTLQRISPFYYGWSADVADFNHDGKPDIVSGPYIYYGPDFTVRRELSPAETSNPSNQYALMLQHATDLNGDGWPDIVGTSLGSGAGGGGYVFINPKGESRRWQKAKVLPAVNSEESLLVDIDKDGRKELIYIADGCVRFAKPDPSDPTKPWTEYNVSERGPMSAHGIGTGDIDGDGRIDILTAYGWWQQPATLDPKTPWTYHAATFGRPGLVATGGAQMGVFDVNGDGLLDVVTSLDAHSWGLAWYEQKRSPQGAISFVEHMVMDNLSTKNAGGVTFTEMHAANVADIDGDGIPDFIVGKRIWSHQDTFADPDAYGGAVLYWYQVVRNRKLPGGAELVPHLIHNWSGAGSEVYVGDVNGDGKPDIITATKLGTDLFLNHVGKK